MAELIWVSKEIRLDGAVRTYYRPSNSSDVGPQHYPYVRTFETGFAVVLTPVANSKGLRDTIFQSLDEAKEYVETAISLGLEVISHD